MRYVVYGAGAVGGVIGGNLHRAGVPTTLVARGAHLEALRRDGLLLRSAGGEDRLDVVTAASAAEVEWTDDTAVLLTVKSHQTAAALDDLVAHAPPDTAVVAAQNGVANETTVLRRFGSTYGICVMLPSGHLEPGVVVQHCHPTPGILDIGRFPTGTDAAAEAIASDLRRAGFESVPRPDIMAWKHRKLVMNLGNAVQACCAPGPATDELYALVRDEGEQVLAAAGIPVVTEDEDRARRADILRIQDRDREKWGGSTWQSVARGVGSVETDYLSGEVVLIGRLHGTPAPANELLQRTAAELARAGGDVGSLDAADLLARLSGT
jgi:2-dehydropantoate 2-reductase